MGLIMGATSILEEYFYPICTPKCFGFLRKVAGLEERVPAILQTGRNQSNACGWQEGDLFVKRLKTEEHYQVPSRRFQNSLYLSLLAQRNVAPGAFPKPMGLIYSGHPANFVIGNSVGFFISKYVSGRQLNHAITSINSKTMDKLFLKLGYVLSILRAEGVYLMDFAPRDIVLTAPSPGSEVPNLALCDTENVDYACAKIEEFTDPLLKKQKAQFREDWRHFFERDRLRRGERRLF